MGKSWFRTAEQDRYLQEQIKELLKARQNDTLKAFRLEVHETWEARWPEIKVVFPERTDEDPQLTKEQVDELSRAMAIRKKVSLILVSVKCFHTEILSLAIIYSCPLARQHKAYSHKESEDVTRALSTQGPTFQGQEGDAQTNNSCHI